MALSLKDLYDMMNSNNMQEEMRKAAGFDADGISLSLLEASDLMQDMPYTVHINANYEASPFESFARYPTMTEGMTAFRVELDRFLTWRLEQSAVTEKGKQTIEKVRETFGSSAEEPIKAFSVGIPIQRWGGHYGGNYGR